MHDPVRVRTRQSVGHRRSDLHRFSPRQLLSREPVRERLSAQQLHHRERDAVLSSKVVNGQDVRVRERRNRLRLLFEPVQRFRIVRGSLGHDLDRYLAPEPRVARPVNFAHSSRAERRNDLIRSEVIARTQNIAAIRLRSGIAQVVFLWPPILSPNRYVWWPKLTPSMRRHYPDVRFGKRS